MKITIFITLLFLLAASLAISKSKLPHQFANPECIICHTNEMASTKVTGDITSKCMTCHTNLYDEGYMHPVDMVPKKVKVPRDMPIGQNGMMTCNTCHDAHASYETPFGSKSKFLRRLESGKAFCDICHMNSLGTAAGHQMVFKDAHTKTAKFSQLSQSMHIDTMSRDCISCHDGSVGSSVMLKAGDWRHSNNFIKYDKGGKHPIGMDYEQVRRTNKKAMLRPISEVDKRIRFFNNGNMGCGSCHDPYSIRDKKLVIDNHESALCFSCHDS